MTNAATIINVSAKTDIAAKTATLSHTTVFLGGTAADPTGGITQGQADARYVRKSQVNAPNGVAGLDANGNLVAGFPWASTNW